LLFPQLGRNNAAHPRSDGLASLIDQDACIVVKFHNAAIWPLPFLCCAYNDSMPYVSSPDLVGGTDGDGIGCLGAKISLFLHYDYDAIACAPVSQVLF
jgi:hypothetical protein